jgi:RimJ/RimL family protein N-acetyltransferase
MADLSAWTKRPTPGVSTLHGERVRLEPLSWQRHGFGLFAAIGGEANADMWTWLPMGPFATPSSLEAFLEAMRQREGWKTMTISEQRSAEVLGMATYMRIREAHGSAEIGCVAFGPKLKRTAAASEALALMARHVFEDLGYRRCEWKCNHRNEASKRAAERFGFIFEGIFRNDMVAKGQSRDTAWYSITDGEWPALKAALENWLAPDNFTSDGQQKRALQSFRA